MNTGDIVKVLPPFGITYTDTYKIVDIQNGVYFLEGIEGGFDVMYLERI